MIFYEVENHTDTDEDELELGEEVLRPGELISLW